MEKTTHISIGGSQFHLTEAAYHKLESYLDSLKSYFSNEEDGSEILRDIESRIAEKLNTNKINLLTEEDIDHVIKEMGEVSQFDIDSTENKSKNNKAGIRKFYRDTDNNIIAGVASGIAYYFDTKAIYIRILFIISILFGGSGLLIYLLLALFTPAAKTASQKLEMRGDAVTLDSISRVVKERIDETRQNSAFEKNLDRTRTIIGRILNIIIKIFGAILYIGSAIAIFFVSAGVAVALTNWNSEYISTAIHNVVSTPIFWLSTGLGYISIVIPLIFILSLGYRMIYDKNGLPNSIGFSLLGVWFIAAIASGALATRVMGNYYKYTSTNPAFIETTQTLDVAPFENLEINNSRVNIIEGPAQSVIITGNTEALNQIQTSVNDQTLSLNTTEREDNFCVLFCNHSNPSITITTPDLNSIKLKESSLTFESFDTTSMDLSLQRASLRGSLTTNSLSIDTEDSSVNANIDTNNFNLVARNSHFNITGQSPEATITLRQSDLDSEMFLINNATLNAVGSMVNIYAKSSLNILENNSSNIKNWATSTPISETD